MELPLTWDIPELEGHTHFFSEENFNKYSQKQEENFLEYLTNKVNFLEGNTVEHPHGQSENPQQKEGVGANPLKETTTVTKRSTTKSIKDSVPTKSTRLPKKRPNDDTQPAEPIRHALDPHAIPRFPGYCPRRFPFPRASSLTKQEQKSYLMLYSKFLNYLPTQPTAKEMQEIVKFRALQMKVGPEQEEFLKFLEGVARESAADYNYIHPEAAQYMEELSLCENRRVELYPKWYSYHDTLPLTVSAKTNSLMKHEKTLLEVGPTPKVVLVNMNDTTKPRTPTEHSKVSKRFPPAGFKAESEFVWNKEVCSRDRNISQLLSNHDVDIVISSGGMTCLLDNHIPDYNRDWEIPVVVKEMEISGVQKKVVIVDKPLPCKQTTVRSRNTRFHKRALRTLITHPVQSKGQKLKQIRQKVQQNGNEADKQTASEKITGNGKGVADDVFESQGFEVEDLETFGVDSAGGFKSFESKSCDLPKKKPISKDILSKKLQEVTAALSGKEMKSTPVSNKSITHTQTIHDIGLVSEGMPIQSQNVFSSSETDDDEKLVIATGSEEEKSPRRRQTRSCAQRSAAAENVSTESEQRVTRSRSENRSESETRSKVETRSRTTKDISEPRHAQNDLLSKNLESLQSESDANVAMTIAGKRTLRSGKTIHENTEPVHLSETTTETKLENSKHSSQAIEKCCPKSAAANSNPSTSSTLDDILGMQQRMLKPELAAKVETSSDTDLYHTKDSDSVFAIPQHSHLRYSLWTFGKLKMLVRCGIHGNLTDDKLQMKPVSIFPKMEYQALYGCEQVTASETSRYWMASFLRQNCNIIRARINSFSSELITLEELDPSKILYPRCPFNPDSAMQIVHHILLKLTSLPPGQYLLSHAEGEPHCQVKKSTNLNKRGSYDLHNAYMSFNRPEFHRQKPVLQQWIPVDPNVFLPFHKKFDRIPATFDPKDFHTGPGKKKKKKKKKS